MTEKELYELQKKVQEKMDKLVPKLIPYVEFLHIVELKFEETKYTPSLDVKLDGKGSYSNNNWNPDWVAKSVRLVKQLFKIFLPEDIRVYVYWE